MRRQIKRLLSASMAVVILLTAAITDTYAFTPSEGADSGGVTVSPGNYPGNGTNPTYPGDHGGVRITVTNMTQAGASNIAPIELGAPYTDAINQFNDLGNILRKKVWQPGDFGLFVVDNNNGIARPATGVINSTTYQTAGVTIIPQEAGAGDYTDRSNLLAWNVYNPGWTTSWPERDGEGHVASYNSDLYNIFLGPEGKAMAAADAMNWVNQVKAKFEDLHGNSNDSKKYSHMFAQLFGTKENLVDPFAKFSWASITPTGDAMYENDAAAHIMWSHIGMKSAVMYYIWACLDEGDNASAQYAASLLQQWVVNGDPDSACAIVAEAVVPYYQGSDPSWWTVGAAFEHAYPGSSYTAMYRGWDESVSTWKEAYERVYSGLSNTDTTKTAILRWLIDGYFRDGAWKKPNALPSGNPKKTYCIGLFMKAVANTQLTGYSIHWPLYAASSPPDIRKEDPPGKFTWKLTPNGTIDKTPDKEMKAPFR